MQDPGFKPRSSQQKNYSVLDVFIHLSLYERDEIGV